MYGTGTGYFLVSACPMLKPFFVDNSRAKPTIFSTGKYYFFETLEWQFYVQIFIYTR